MNEFSGVATRASLPNQSRPAVWRDHMKRGHTPKSASRTLASSKTVAPPRTGRFPWSSPAARAPQLRRIASGVHAMEMLAPEEA
jgi:hypothetical protein